MSDSPRRTSQSNEAELREAEEALKLDSRDIDAAIQGMHALVRAGQSDDVEAWLSRVDEEFHGQADILVARARAAIGREDTVEAMEFLRQAADADPKNPDPIIILAQLEYLADEDGERVVELARLARDRAPSRVDIALEAIDLFHRVDRVSEAKAEAARLLGSHKDDPAIVSGLGFEALRQGDMDLAINLLCQAAVAHRPDPSVFHPLGLLFWDHLRGEEFARGIHLLKVLKFGVDPENLRELGWIELITGHRAAACTLLVASADVFDPPVPPLLLAQWSGESMGSSVGAALEAIAPPCPAVVSRGAAAYFRSRGLPDMEEVWLRRALHEAPDTPRIRFELAELLSGAPGREEDAARLLADIDPDALGSDDAKEFEELLRAIDGSDQEARTLRPDGEEGPGVLHDQGRLLGGDEASGPQWRGRGDLVERVMRILSRPMNRSVVVAGETGVGKTALVHEVARRIQREECPADLVGHRVVELSPTALQTDIKYLGEWQTKITRLVEEVRDHPGTILYVPRFHHLMGAGATTGHEEDMAGALAPLLESGQLVVIADAAPEPLRRMLRKRPEMDRALTVVELAEPDSTQVKEVLESAREWIRGADGPRIESAAIDRAIDLCGRFLRHRRFPAKAIDLLRSTCESVGEEGGSIVTPEDVAAETSATTGLPRFLLLDSEPLQIDKARDYFEERVLGQDEALEALLDTIARIKTGLQDPQRPLGTYLFTGPTGVGKTETAKALASFLFGDERRLVRFDMSEYADSLAAERLIEARDGRLDSGARGHLTGAVRENPLAVVLLDEIEKAHPRVFDLLLQVLGEGRLTDARGETVDFRECVVLMTSNLGAERAADGGLGFKVDKAAAEARAIREEVERFFRPEFLNRLDRIVSFHRLNRDMLHTIALREVGRCLGREGVVRRGVVVDTDPNVADLVLDRGMSNRYGARQLKRAVEELVAVPLARVLSQRVLSVDDTVRLQVEGEQVVAEIVRDDVRGSTSSATTTPPAARRPASIGQIEEDLADVADRIEALDAFLGIADARAREEMLRKEMERPGFWDDTRRASAHLRELADVNHLLDRHKKVHSHREEVALLLDLMKDGHRELMPEAGQKVKALGQSIDVMEVETLLTDPLDSRGAFVVVSAGARDGASHHWAGELVRLYSRWGRRRGLDVRLVAERMPGDAGGRSAIVYVGGHNAYGLLRMETGTHRKVHAPGDVRQVVTAKVRVYPEPKLDSVGSQLTLPSYRAARSRDLKFLRRATGIVTLPTPGDPWMLLTDLPEEQVLEAMKDLAEGIEETYEVVDEQATEIARTFVLDRRRQVRDPRSGHETTDTRLVLDGSIDDFILAGLTMSPDAIQAAKSVDEAS